MAFNCNISYNYATHLPCLIKAVEKTKGDILELGTGVFSTPYLHYVAILQNRKLVSYENFPEWAGNFFKYRYLCENHEIYLVDSYSWIPIDKPWDVVLLDQTPDSSRAEEAIRLKNLAQYIILHDANPEKDRTYHYSTVYPHFKYKTLWEKDGRKAAVVSNFNDLTNFWQ